MATDKSNTVFHHRGTVKGPAQAVGLANQMSRYGLEIYVGHDIGRTVGRADIHNNGMGRAYPNKILGVVYHVNSRPKKWWARIFGR
jgi:hypothetical protein